MVNVMHNKPSENSQLIIRDARAEDLDEVSRLLRDAYLEYQKHFPEEDWKHYLDNIMNVRSRLSESELIVAELGGRIAGAVTLYLDGNRDGWPQGAAGIRLLGVHPNYRGRGISRALMQECIRRCQKRKIATVCLHTAEIMSIAWKMYERMGFKRETEYDFHPRPDRVVMAYCLQI